MNLFKTLFCREKTPVPGEKWLFQGVHNDPWGPKDYRPVTILDVKAGWVRYSMGYPFDDERKELGLFTSMYQPTEEA